MLFNSFEFIFLFLPITVVVFFWIGNRVENVERQLPILWLVIASLIFYGRWKPLNLVLIIFSMIINYRLGNLLGNVIEKPLANT